MFDNIDMEKFVDEYIKRQEESRWKNEAKYNDFLKYLVDFIKEHKRVTSDNFYYKEEECKPYTYREFEEYLNSLYDIVDEYGRKNFINDEFNITEEDYFTEKAYCLKIKDCFYKIELVSGQGSYVFLELINNNNNIAYVDYDLMIEDKPSPFYEHNIKGIVSNHIKDLINEFVDDGVDKNLILSYIKEVAEEEVNND